MSVEFTTPSAAAEGYWLDLQTNTNSILADGHSNTLITCTVKDKDGNVYEDKDFTIEFKTNGRGHFTRSEVVTTKGVTSNTLVSEALDKAEDVVITAQIVRTVIGDDLGEEFKGVNGTKTLTMTPEIPNLQFNPVTMAESNYADRVTLRFQENVNDDVYKTDGNLDASKLNIEIWDDIPNTNSLPTTSADYTIANEGIVNIKEVQGEPKALHVLVNSPLTNNRTIGVRVTQTDPTTKKVSTYTEIFKLTDAQRPQLLSVQADDRRTLRVTFSEAVITQELALDTANGIDRTQYAADRLENYNIGTENLSSKVWGQRNSATEADRVTFKVGDGRGNNEDRNIVTIKLGKKEDGEYARLAANVLTYLSVNNVGDWACKTSASNNVITTDEKEFIVDDDTSAPEIDNVVVQSPEQYLVTFKAPVEIAAAYKKANPDISGIEAKNHDDATAPSETPNGETSVIQLLNENDKNIGAGGSDNPIRVSQIGTDKTQYLIETTRDWTQVYDWSSSNNDNYYNHTFRLMIPANALVNINNGVKNTSSITYALTANHEIMRQADLKMPTSTGATWHSNVGNYGEVTMNFDEPVKVRLENSETGLNDEGLTPSVQQQQNTTYKGVQPATARFYATGYPEVSGTIVRMGDTQDMSVVVQPNEELAGNVDGVKWRLHISGASDDVFNTFSADQEFTVYKDKNNFRVAWASVSTEPVYDWSRWNGATVGNKTLPSYWNAGSNTNRWTDGTSIYVFVKFTDELDKNSTQAMRALNYMFNSSQLSTDVKITAGIRGYDKKTDGTDISGIRDSVTIEIPRNSAYLLGESPQNVMLKITDAVKSASGESLENNVEYPLPYGSDLRLGANIDGTSRVDTNDAVYGDDTDEQAGTGYRTKVQTAINSGNYRLIQLQQDITGDLTINEPVDIDLNGHNIYGTVKAQFNDGATCHIVNSNATAPNETISELEIRTPNADWYLGDAAVGEKLTFVNVDVRNMPANTLHNFATINTLEVNSGSNEVGIVNGEDGILSKVVISNVSSNGTVKLRNDNSSNKIQEVTVNSSVKIVAENGKGTIEKIIVNALKNVVIATKKGVIEEVSGNKSAYEITDTDGKTNAGLVDKITVDTEDSVKNVLKDAFVSEVTKSVSTTGAAITVGDIVKSVGNNIDKDGGIIEGYTIKAKLNGSAEKSFALSGDGKKFAFTNKDEVLWSNVTNGSKITIVIVKDTEPTNEITAVSIPVTVNVTTS